uniref:sugar-binding domain-containing protein n=1 Tax=Paractinoplanes polyasparticus TaxID=2856853 RepID=UPI001C862308|nr:sugar-binding domain-containing protein [Actinoplanes polyasparticus]
MSWFSWQLKIFDKPGGVPVAFRAGGAATAGWPTASVPHTWQPDFIDHPMFRNIPSDIAPDDPPKVPRDVNPTGAYVKTFDLPASWSGGRVFLRFEGVTSNYLVWVNGGYTGYDQGGYTPAESDITERLKPGRNTIAVQVHRWGSGAYIEDVDQWRYSGIFRDVWLYRTNEERLQDAYITTDLDADYCDANLRVAVQKTGGAQTKGTLLDASGRAVTTMTGDATLTALIKNPAKVAVDEEQLRRQSPIPDQRLHHRPRHHRRQRPPRGRMRNP